MWSPLADIADRELTGAGGRGIIGASRASTAVGRLPEVNRPPASPVDLVVFAVGEVLRDDAVGNTGKGADALPAILGALATLFGCPAAIALRQDTGQELAVLAAHPGPAAVDQALLAQLSALSADHEELADSGGYVEATLTVDGKPVSVRLAYAASDAGRCLCAVVLVGEPVRFAAECRTTTRGIAAIVAAQVRHANDTAELADRQARTLAIVEGSPNAIVAADSGMRLVTWNKAAEDLTGWRRDEVLGKNMPEVLVPERDRAAVMEGTSTYLASGDRGKFVGQLRMPISRADGTERIVELTPVPITVNGEVYFCGFLRDISELERANAALQESETRFRLLSQLAPVGIVMTDLNGMYTFANVRWCELAGMTMAQALSARWPAGIHPDDVDRLAQEWELAAATDSELSTDCRLESAAEMQPWVHLSVIPILGRDGNISGYLGAVTDISERKRAEAERERLLSAERAARRGLADQTGRLNSLIAAAIPGILVSDEQGTITQVNQSFCGMFDLEGQGEQFTGTSAADMVLRIKEAFADPDEFVRRTGTARTARQPVDGQEIECADGRTFECDYWPVFIDGDYRGDMWLVWDMSERKAFADQRERLLQAELAAREAAERDQARLLEQNARLQALDDAKTQFISTMSHELRTPLTSIISFTELIMDDERGLSADTVSSLSVIQRNAGRLLHLVSELLLLSRLEHGVIPLDLVAVSVPDLISEAASSASASAAERGLTLDVDVMAGPTVQADPLRLGQVMDNLLANAIKYTGQDGKVRVKAAHDGQRWRIDVTDTGIGIPADELGQVFDRFVRGSNARLAGLPGAGLGLAVVKAIAELHGGSVKVRSVTEQGSMFSVYLPIRP